MKCKFEVVPQDTEESEFLDLMDFEDVAFSVETVIHRDTLPTPLLLNNT